MEGSQGSQNAEDANILSPKGFTQIFGTRTLGEDPFDRKSVSFVVQLGFITNSGDGRLMRYYGGASVLRYRSLSNSKDLSVENEWVVPGKEFSRLVSSVLVSAPTAPVSLEEAMAISSNLGGTVWLFEYLDPLDGRISMVTIDGLPQGFGDRSHSLLKKSFDNVLAYIEANSARFEPRRTAAGKRRCQGSKENRKAPQTRNRGQTT